MAFVNYFGNNPGINEPILNAPKTLQELLDCFSHAPSNSVWRGQASFMWAPLPTLYRRLRQSGYADCQINEAMVRRAESLTIADARKRGLVDDGESILKFMACLQHHGGATRLLDVTHDWRVALFFASSDRPNECGTVIAYRVSPDRRVSPHENDSCTSSQNWDDVINACQDGRALLVEPEACDARIVAQRGAFVMTSLAESLASPNLFTNQTYDSEVRHILISPQLKSELETYLSNEGITKDCLFPDTAFEDFGRNHSANTPIDGLP